MKIKFILALAGGMAAALVPLGLGQEKPPIVRMDLLPKKDRPAMSIRRDIFLPQAPGAGLSPEFDELTGRPIQLRPGGGEIKAPEPSLAVRYIGYIRGKEKITALIFFEGQVLAVSEGDPLGQAWKIASISTTEIEIRGEDGTTQKFALEGERK
jgi:hypothetical protein